MMVARNLPIPAASKIRIFVRKQNLKFPCLLRHSSKKADPWPASSRTQIHNRSAIRRIERPLQPRSNGRIGMKQIHSKSKSIGDPIP